MIRMPWNNETAPNSMIEVVDACNVKCRVCYRKLTKNVRSLGQVAQDLDDACRLRKLHTVTLTGGEPTLHPELKTIIHRLTDMDLSVGLVTNGLLLGQRPGLSEHPSIPDTDSDGCPPQDGSILPGSIKFFGQNPHRSIGPPPW